MDAVVDKPDFYFSQGATAPKQLMSIIQNDQDNSQFGAVTLTRAFLDMKKRVGWNVPMFDIPAAEKWCAGHNPKCDE